MYGAQKSLLITVFGGLSLLGGLILMTLSGHSTSIRHLIAHASEIQSSPTFILAMILILFWCNDKICTIPILHLVARCDGSTDTCQRLLAFSDYGKAGIYLVARLTPIFALSEGWIWTVTAIGLITLFWGSLNATKQLDLKGILAFSTVSQLGMVMAMLGIGAVSYHYQGAQSQFYAAAFIAAVFHLINHATFKCALFMVAGIIDHETGTRDVRKLGGLMTVMPISFTITVITALSMAGVPPFNGFLSKAS